uniref:Uncharacterized protein n=1 Tax=viral metagenome TaxID=1070528 RepID=A0A6H2A368_9ZZZZ
MKCPLIREFDYHDGKETQVVMLNCLQAECAWWDEILKRCSVKTLGTCLDGILLTVKELYKKIPHEAQFRK